MESFEKIVRNYYLLSDDSIALLKPYIQIVTLSKNVCFIKQGSIKNSIYFLAEGLLKTSIIIENKEYTLSFYKETDCLLGSINFSGKSIPNSFSVITLKKSILYVIDKNHIEKLINNKNVDIILFVIKLLDRERADVINGIIRYKCYSPTDIYKLTSLFCPEIFHNISVNEMATFLGITNSSLSRIRKKITKGKQQFNKSKRRINSEINNK